MKILEFKINVINTSEIVNVKLKKKKKKKKKQKKNYKKKFLTNSLKI